MCIKNSEAYLPRFPVSTWTRWEQSDKEKQVWLASRMVICHCAPDPLWAPGSRLLWATWPRLPTAPCACWVQALPGGPSGSHCPSCDCILWPSTLSSNSYQGSGDTVLLPVPCDKNKPKKKKKLNPGSATTYLCRAGVSDVRCEDKHAERSWSAKAKFLVLTFSIPDWFKGTKNRTLGSGKLVSGRGPSLFSKTLPVPAQRPS